MKKAEEPMTVRNLGSNSAVPHLRSYLLDKVEKVDDMAVLQQIYAIVTPQSKETYAEKFAQAKEQTERYCTPDLAEELEQEGYMIGKSYPSVDEPFDLEKAIADDALDEVAPQEWIDKMFPELHVKG